MNKIWIKTQGKTFKELVLCDDITIVVNLKKCWEFRNYENKEDYTILGFYKSEEKANKILNEIEEVINSGEIGVYHMPEDESE